MAEDRDDAPRRPATERADELLSHVGQTAGIFASLIGVHVARVAAFAREEVEDMWAEARAMREGESVTGPTGNKEADEEASKPGDEPVGVVKPGDYVGATARSEEKPERASEQSDAGPDGEAETIDATAAARHQAEELGVDLREVEGTGSKGQITVADVRKRAESKT
jgi:pyruvate/2-oxoglutarate dehydrogenase complex dihydrolipoamide acyltransferase (E2) component